MDRSAPLKPAQKKWKRPTIKCQWTPAPAQLSLAEGEIHLWRADLSRPDWPVTQLAETLSTDERRRAERFHFERDRRSFIISRGLLRLTLGHYLQIKPGDVSFHYGPFGKPALPKTLNPEEFCFNLTHSHHLSLYAISRHPVGVDVEYIRPIPDLEIVAQQFFSTSEYATLQALPPTQQLEVFFNGWTRKEAYLKASGHGLSQSPREIEVTLAPGEPTQLLLPPGQSAHWVLQALTPAPGYTAALVATGPYQQLKCWQWP